MNIKNWFKSPEGPMDMEAEVRKLRNSNRWLTFILRPRACLGVFLVYLYTTHDYGNVPR